MAPLTCAAMMRWRSWISSHFAHRQLRYEQCFLWPRNPDITPWLRHLRKWKKIAVCLDTKMNGALTKTTKKYIYLHANNNTSDIINKWEVINATISQDNLTDTHNALANTTFFDEPRKNCTEIYSYEPCTFGYATVTQWFMSRLRWWRHFLPMFYLVFFCVPARYT